MGPPIIWWRMPCPGPQAERATASPRLPLCIRVPSVDVRARSNRSLLQRAGGSTHVQARSLFDRSGSVGAPKTRGSQGHSGRSLPWSQPRRRRPCRTARGGSRPGARRCSTCCCWGFIKEEVGQRWSSGIKDRDELPLAPFSFWTVPVSCRSIDPHNPQSRRTATKKKSTSN